MNVYLFFLFSSLFLIFSCSSLTLDKKNNQNSDLAGFQKDSFFENEASTQTKEAVTSEEKHKIAHQKNDPEIGYAAWYGRELHGKLTASGSIFNMNHYTAAHRSLPIGSQVMVTNLDNEKKRIVTINDRGPYVEGRIIDVSYKTAMDLGFAEKGIAKVKVELIKKGSFSFLSKLDSPAESTKAIKTVTLEANNANNKEENTQSNELFDNLKSDDYSFSDGRKPKGYTIQVGAFENKRNAENYRDEIEERFNHRGFIASRGRWYFVWVGEFGSSEKAKQTMKKFKEEGIDTVYRGKMF